MATALWVTQPTEPIELAITVSVGAFAALLPDIDVKNSKVNPIVKKITIGFVALLGGISIYSKANNLTLVQGINNSGIASILLGMAILIAFCIYGSTQPHRGFTHSIAATAIATISIALIVPSMIPAFVVGYISHLAIDYPNKKGEQLLWPLDGRYCLNLCTSSGVVASVTRFVSYLIASLYALALAQGFIK